MSTSAAARNVGSVTPMISNESSPMEETSAVIISEPISDKVNISNTRDQPKLSVGFATKEEELVDKTVKVEATELKTNITSQNPAQVESDQPIVTSVNILVRMIMS